ncbi:GDSL esterase/lipase At1g71250-like [Malania oleifera]|uniref:GDSL esterase/lipase At1g71250-like n=1 Tax=Malania oleifera TaxID=397392 RepID=UPI0025AEB25B|nr:GDSL esterase/lipase At1g71250-like [Malania oleifera]
MTGKTTACAPALPLFLSSSFCFFLACFVPYAFYCACGAEGGGDHTHEGAKVKGMFVFGSSLVDNGNNNFLPNTMAKADYLPYGIDFPLGPSGRFTNGRNVVDFLGDLLHLPSLIPPFADPSTRGSRIIHGVNFASAASGILDTTGSVAGRVMSMNEQIKKFEEITVPELEAEVGRRSRESLLHEYLFMVGTGGNDYSLNYFLRKSNSHHNTTVSDLQAFTAILTASLSSQLKKLYKLGGRKFVVISVNPIGCSPGLRLEKKERCVGVLNLAARLFNQRLKSLVDEMKPQMPGSSLVYVSSYNIIMDIISHPLSKGISDVRNACCEVESKEEGGNGILCRKGGRVCANRNLHLFFDGLHPTEAVNFHIATKAFASTHPHEVYPVNVKKLAQL